MPPKYSRFLGVPIYNVNNNVKCFIKKEKISLTKYTAPRLIQHNTMAYNIEVGRYIKQLEHKIYQKDSSSQKYEFCKTDLPEMARRIMYKASKFQNPKFVCIDHKQFEAHLNGQHINLENAFINWHYRSPYLQRLLDARTIFGTTTSGIKYRTSMTRTSGHVKTSFGNSILNLAFIKHVLKQLKIRKFEVMVNGDDSIIIIENRCHLNESQLKREFRKLNMETKIDQITNNIYDVEFCRMKICIDNAGKPMMYLTPDRIKKIFAQTHKPMRRNDYVRDLAYANSCIYKNLENYHSVFTDIYNHYNSLATTQLNKYLKLEPLILSLYKAASPDPRVSDPMPHYTQPKLSPPRSMPNFKLAVPKSKLSAGSQRFLSRMVSSSRKFIFPEVFQETDATNITRHVYINHHTQTLTVTHGPRPPEPTSFPNPNLPFPTPM